MKTLLATVALLLSLSVPASAEWVLYVDLGAGFQIRGITKTKDVCMYTATNAVSEYSTPRAVQAGCAELVPYHIVKITDSKGRVTQIVR